MPKKLFAQPEGNWVPVPHPSDLLMEEKPIQIDADDWEAFVAAQESLRLRAELEPTIAIKAAREAEAFGLPMDTAWLPPGGWDTVATALLSSEISQVNSSQNRAVVFGLDASTMLKAIWEKAIIGPWAALGNEPPA